MVRGLLEDALVMTRLLSNRCLRSLNVVDISHGENDRNVFDLTMAQRADSYVYQSYSV